MPTINVAYWNIQNFGDTPGYKASYGPLLSFVAEVVDRLEIDVLLIQEVRRGAIANQHLQRLMAELWSLPAPRNNWYYEWIKGSIRAGGIPGPVPPYATSNDLDWDAAHNEGYAVFWNQNIAKFKVTPAPPITPPGGGPVPNTQSESVRIRGDVQFMAVPLWGIAVPPGGIVAPQGPAYRLPQYTTAPNGLPIIDAATGAVVVPAGGVLNGPAVVSGGTVLPAGTVVGGGGVQVAVQVYQRNPVVIPEGYVLTEACTLPAPGEVLVPEHALSLVLTGRDTRGGGQAPATANGDVSGVAANFVPGANNPWQYLNFTRGAGFPAMLTGCRRPAFLTIDVNMAGAPGPAQRLIPLIVYHAPSAVPASSSGMQRAAYSRPLYQAYDHGGGGWIDNARAVLGGDMNVRLDAVDYAYNAFTNGFGGVGVGGGANCRIRVAHPAPGPPPATRAQNVLNKTTVQLQTAPGHGVPIIHPATDAYRKMAIDNVFYRGFTPAEAPAPAPDAVHDLLPALTGAAGAYNVPAPRVSSFLGLQIFDDHWNVAWGFAPGPAPVTPEIRSIRDFVFDIALGAFVAAGGPAGPPPARRAAEFVNLCVSDHLPVLFTMNL